MDLCPCIVYLYILFICHSEMPGSLKYFFYTPLAPYSLTYWHLFYFSKFVWYLAQWLIWWHLQIYKSPSWGRFFFFGELLNFSGSTVNYFRWYLHFWVFKYRCSVWVFWILLAVDVNQFYMGHPAPKINGKKLRSQSFVILPIFINISMLLKSIVFILFKFI